MKYTEEQLELKKYLEECNQKRREEMKAQGVTFYTLPDEDIDRWIEAGINNIAEFKHDEAASTHSDMTKDIYGFRMRYPYGEMATEDIWEDVARMADEQRAAVEYKENLKLEEEKMAQERKKDNKYQGNFAFKGLDGMMR